MRILVTDGMEATAVAALKSKGYEVVEHFYPAEELIKEIADYDVLVVRSATKVRQPIIDAAHASGRLKLIIRGGVGVDNIDVAYAESKGIKVTNTPKASSASVAEYAIGSMFSLARYLYQANLTMKEGKWEKKHYEGIELAGKTLGLIGFGRIAQELAKKASALGMNVIYTNRHGTNENFPEFTYMPLDKVLSESDFISLHIPSSKDHKPLLTAAEFAKMKDGVYLVNSARGDVIDEEALLAALDSGKVAAAALDVFSKEPLDNEKIAKHPKISLTPHIGGSTIEAQSRIGNEIVQIITSFLA